ncbi:MAG: peptidylprolyl isomerase [bacterium]|nr:peptidylprolyl isomerase [bacterium]
MTRTCYRPRWIRSTLCRMRLTVQVGLILTVVVGTLGGYGNRLGQAQTAQLLDGIAAVVNDEIITISEVWETMELEAEQLRQQYRDEGLRERLTDLYQRALKQLINVRLQLAWARKLRLQVDDDDVTQHIETIKEQNKVSDERLSQMLKARGLTLEAYREQVRESLLIAKVVNVEVRSRLVVMDTELQEAYQKQRERYSVPGELTVSHILFLVSPDASGGGQTPARKRATTVLNQLRNGGDFAELAKKYSEGPSAERGGLLGRFRAGELLSGFEKAALALQPGEISGIIHTRAGLHIIRVEDKKEGGYRPFAEVREAIKSKLLQTKSERKYREWLETLRQGAYVKVLYEG